MDFYQKLSEYYDVIFPVNPMQVQFIRKQAGNSLRILDIAAGTGTLAIELAKSGFSITALDLEEKMVKQIREKIQKEQVKLDAYCLDMRNLDQLNDHPYELICCLGNSIVHLNSREEIQDTVRKMYALLENRGKVIIQTVNYDRILRQGIDQLPVIEKEGVCFIRSYEWADPYIQFHGNLTVENSVGSSQTFHATTKLFPLTSTEWVTILTDCGFHHIELWGSFIPDHFGSNSPAIIVVARK